MCGDENAFYFLGFFLFFFICFSSYFLHVNWSKQIETIIHGRLKYQLFPLNPDIFFISTASMHFVCFFRKWGKILHLTGKSKSATSILYKLKNMGRYYPYLVAKFTVFSTPWFCLLIWCIVQYRSILTKFCKQENTPFFSLWRHKCTLNMEWSSNTVIKS